MPMLALPVALVSDSAAPCTTCSLRHLTLRSCALERGVPFLTDSSMVLNASSSGPRVISMGWMRLGRWSNAVDDEEGTSVLHALVVLVQQLELVVREVRPIQLENLPEGREVDGLRSSMDTQEQEELGGGDGGEAEGLGALGAPLTSSESPPPVSASPSCDSTSSLCSTELGVPSSRWTRTLSVRES